MATDMCHVHNLIIRGMNSIYLQSPYVKTPSDIADLFFYTKTLIACINAHHDGEEKYLFPGLIAYTGNSNIMSVNQVQHAAFHAGLKQLDEYCTLTPPAEYSDSTFGTTITSFATPLYQHLSEEISTILALKDIPNKDLKVLWAKAEKHINDVGSFDEMFPLAFGCIDKGFEAGQHKFPPVPGVVNFVVKYWFARKHQSVWRFNPCDMWGTPRPLYFLQNEEDKDRSED
jgi:Hemerythrin HHE cation binding domain